MNCSDIVCTIISEISINDIIGLIISIISLYIAAKAIKLTKKQIKLSNKHALFDKRLNAYTETQELCNIYENMKNLMKTLYTERNYYQIDIIRLYLNELTNHIEPIRKHTYIKNMINMHDFL